MLIMVHWCPRLTKLTKYLRNSRLEKKNPEWHASFEKKKNSIPFLYVACLEDLEHLVEVSSENNHTLK